MVKANERPARTRKGGVASHLGLENERLVELYRTMLASRLIQDRMFVLQRQGRAAFAISGQGHEAAQVGSAAALKPGTDWVIPYYRDVGVCLTMGMTAREIMLDFLARAEGPCSGGRQMPTHWSKRELNIVSGSSPVGTQILHAPGVAWASTGRSSSGRKPSRSTSRRSCCACRSPTRARASSPIGSMPSSSLSLKPTAR